MSRCSCAQATCQCVEQDTATIANSGAGSAGSPYEHDIIPTGVAPLLISTDAGNALVLGTDGLLKTGGPKTLFSKSARVDAVAPGPFTTYGSFSVVANQLSANNDRLVIRAEFIFDAALFDFNGFVFSLAGIPFASKPLTQALVSGARCEYELFRTGALAAKCVGHLTIDDNGAGSPIIQTTNTTIACNWAVGQTFLLQLETASALGSELSGESLTVDYHPAP